IAAKFPILLGVILATLLLVSHDVAHAAEQAGPSEPQLPEGYGSGYMQPGHGGAYYTPPYTGGGGNGQNGGGGSGYYHNP
uniref:Glycine-rich protein n=1 Tax=Oryza glaberrima TaxID=4538 RepID=I1QYJ0_ORYGL